MQVFGAVAVRRTTRRSLAARRSRRSLASKNSMRAPLLEPEPQPSWEAGRGLAAPSWTAQACCCPRRRVTCGGLGSSWRCALPESACRDFRYKRLTPAHAGRRYSRLRGTGSASWFQLTHGAAAVVTAGSRTLPPRAAHERWWHRLGPELLHSPVAEGRAASTWPQSLGEKGGAYPKTP